MSNLDLLKKIRAEYDPKTAFNNKVIIGLINKIVLPNKGGKFETIATVNEVHVVSVSWECVDCGRIKREEMDYFDSSYEILYRVCDCGAKHRIEIEEV